jgi:hypothetical protein
MKPTLQKMESDLDRSGNLADHPLGASDACESEDPDDEVLVAATQRRSGTKPPQKKRSAVVKTPPKRSKASAVRSQRNSSSSSTLRKSNARKNTRHNPLFPIPESIGLPEGEEEEEEMDSSSTSEEYDEPQGDDDLEVLWPSVVQAGARLSEARTWTTRPSPYNHSRKRPRSGEEDAAFAPPPHIQHYDPVARPTALKERMRTFVTYALLPEDASQQLQNSQSAHSCGNSASTLDFTEGCHRRLVEAIFEIGMSHASPAVIMEHMVFPTADWVDDSGQRLESLVEQVTSERVKSHLQKYRKNKHKSKEEYMREYDRWTQKALTVVGGISAAARTNLVITPTAVLHMMGHSSGGVEDVSSSKSSIAEPSHRLLGGDLPAYLTFSVMLEEEHAKILREEGGVPTAAALQRRSSHSTDFSTARAADASGAIATQQTATLPSAREYAQTLSGARVLLPILSEEERQSSLGISISHVVGLFYSMSHALMKERKKEQQKSKSAAPAESANPPPPRSEFRPVPEQGAEHTESESQVTAKSSAGRNPPSSSSAAEAPHRHTKHLRTTESGDYYVTSATPTTTSTATTSGDPDPDHRRGSADNERYSTEHTYVSYGQQPYHHSSYEISQYHHDPGGSHPPYPPHPPPRYPPPPHYSSHLPSNDGHPPPHGSYTSRGGHYEL